MNFMGSPMGTAEGHSHQYWRSHPREGRPRPRLAEDFHAAGHLRGGHEEKQRQAAGRGDVRRPPEFIRPRAPKHHGIPCPELKQVIGLIN